MSQNLPPYIETAAAQGNLGEHRVTYRPSRSKDAERLHLFENGIVAQARNGVDLLAVRWGALHVYEEIVSRSSVVFRSYTFVSGGDGRRFYAGNWPKADEFGPVVQQSVFQAWLPWVIDNYFAQGKTWKIVTNDRKPKNNLALGPQGLTVGRKLYPWGEIRSVEIKVGSLYVKVAGKLGPVGYSASQIPNVQVVLGAARYLHAQAQS